MPLKLVPPKAGRSPYYRIRGTYLGVQCDRSTKSREKALAAKILRKVEADIEAGALTGRGAVGFAGAASAYMRAGGDRSYLAPLIEHFRDTPLPIDQIAIDNAAAALYPEATAATRNRQVYTPISAVQKRVGFTQAIKRPKGWRGRKLTHWLTPKQAFSIFRAIRRIKAPKETRIKFRILLILLCYTGMRLGDALGLKCANINLRRSEALIEMTKNGHPRLVYLPPAVVQELRAFPRGLNRQGRLFSFHNGGRLRNLLKEALSLAGVVLPERVAFHVFSHTWATWMRRYGGLDTYDLVDTDRWRDPDSADRYAHVVVNETARKANLLPGAKKRIA